MVTRRFTPKALALATAAALGAGAVIGSPAAQAGTDSWMDQLQLDNTDRLGDAAVFQYYSAKGNWQTFFRIINTSDDAVVVKLRFREAANSREVLDFAIALSPWDMWSAWTGKDAFGDGSGPGIRSNDTSCIFPPVGSSPTNKDSFKRISGNLIAALFKDSAFTGPYDDKAGIDPVARLSEGHLEVIGIASFDAEGPGNNGRFVDLVSHKDDGKPDGCNSAYNLWLSNANSDFGADVPNVLAFNGYMANVPTGQGAGYDPDVLRNCELRSLRSDSLATDTDPDFDSCQPGAFEAQTGVALNQALWNGVTPTPGSTTTYQVDLDQSGTIDGTTRTVFEIGYSSCVSYPENAVPKSVYDKALSLSLRSGGNVQGCDVGQVAEGTGQTFFTATVVEDDAFPEPWRLKQKGIAGTTPVTGGVDNVSARFMRTSVINEWAASNNPAAIIQDYFTQWVLLFPTKHYYVDLQDDPALGIPEDDISPTLVASGVPGAPEAFAPFWASFEPGAGVNQFNVEGKSCEPFVIDMWNREERYSSFTSPEPYIEDSLCYETNVVTFNEAYEGLGLASSFSVTVDAANLPTDADGTVSERGWAELIFVGSGTETGLVEMYCDHATAGSLSTDCQQQKLVHYGLPVTGFMFSVYNTDSRTMNQTAINAHKYTRERSKVVPR